jgi:acetyltransferase-like isoleucine patch superfamily enzyme
MKDNTRSSTGSKVNSELIHLGIGATIDEGVQLGYPPSRKVDQTLTIGSGAHVRSGTIIYGGSSIGADMETGHNVIIREQNEIGDHFRIWNNAVIDYGCKIGNNVKIHNKVYLGQFTTVEDDVFMAPGVTCANDMHPGCPDSSACMRGHTIKKGAQIGINCTILPRVVIGEHSVIGAGSVVTKNIPAGKVAYGNPAKVAGNIGDLTCSSGMRDKPYSHLVEGV